MEPQANPQPQPVSPSPNQPKSPGQYSAPPTSPPQEQIIQTQPGMFSGRLNRLGYLMSIVYIILYFLIPVALQLLVSGASGAKTLVNLTTILMGMVGVALAIPVGISIGIRRWHDLNQSGFFVLLGLIPFVGLIAFIIQLLFPGTQGANKYGDPDTGPATIKKVLFGR
ncbi:MAG: DUF805 domain-containing protein [Candidatus Saccharimonadales bacterium]